MSQSRFAWLTGTLSLLSWRSCLEFVDFNSWESRRTWHHYFRTSTRQNKSMALVEKQDCFVIVITSVFWTLLLCSVQLTAPASPFPDLNPCSLMVDAVWSLMLAPGDLFALLSFFSRPYSFGEFHSWQQSRHLMKRPCMCAWMDEWVNKLEITQQVRRFLFPLFVCREFSPLERPEQNASQNFCFYLKFYFRGRNWTRKWFPRRLGSLFSIPYTCVFICVTCLASGHLSFGMHRGRASL